MSWCRHRSAPYRYTNRTVYGTVERLVCDCGETLPLGPANDTPEVLVEVRAAELVSLHYRSLRGVTFTADELCGWDPSIARAFKLGKARRLDEFEAGLLARVIVDTHKEDDRD